MHAQDYMVNLSNESLHFSHYQEEIRVFKPIYEKYPENRNQRFGVRGQQYTDDTILYWSFTSAGVAVVVLDCYLALVMDWMTANKMMFNPDKTEGRAP